MRVLGVFSGIWFYPLAEHYGIFARKLRNAAFASKKPTPNFRVLQAHTCKEVPMD